MVDTYGSVIDNTPWYWQQPFEQKVSSRWLRFLWAVENRIATPKNGDIIYNTTTNNVEIYNQQYYQSYWALEVTQPILWNVWDLVKYNWQLREAVQWPALTGWWVPIADLPSSPRWVATQKISWWVWWRTYYAETYSSITLSAWSTNIWWTIGQWISSIQWSLLDYAIRIPYNWYYLIVATVEYNEISGEATRGISAIADTSMWWPPSLINLNGIEYAPGTLNATTTWTDSVWWSITATTTVSRWLQVWYTQQYVKTALLKKWYIITVRANHDDPTPRQAFCWFSITQL